MTYTVHINGHKDMPTLDAEKEFEQAQADTAKRLVAELDGVLSASFSSVQLGVVNLKEAQ